MTTTAGAPAVSQRAHEFAAGVREHLSDLPADELDDLLDGLEADLEDRLADGGELGDPAAYADELRQAAGLPDPVATDIRKRSLAERLGDARADVTAWFAASPGRRGTRDFLVAIRPLWWVLRAAVATGLALVLLGHPVVNGLPLSFPAVLLFAAVTVVSVQWGRGTWLPRNWLRHLPTVANALAIVLLLPGTAIAWNALTSPNYVSVEEDLSYTGLQSGGAQVSNIFAYDCTGNLLDAVRLYDQDGRPLTTTEGDDAESTPPQTWDERTGETSELRFNPLASDAEAWNVFPLSVAALAPATWEPGTPTAAEPPRAQLAPLAQDCGATDEGAARDAKGDAAQSGSAKGADGATGGTGSGASGSSAR